MKRRFLQKLFTLWHTKGAFDTTAEYAVMAEAMMAKYGVSFENEGYQIWFYQSIVEAPEWKSFLSAAAKVMDFTQAVFHNVESECTRG
ncbi:hypothetical protein [Chitinophaga sp. sic0106]|uniref:hypothetical protein n=1 Tax=Chitinophaga sp. sic0106 TaxID=2854785 RepID=UPI001C47B2DE|nr:hypothetical protein [Chitinophaga sp. sic0106]MBV7534080.1 hypothetical protein [Chitinophaga sp. sic0106]